MPSGPDYFVMVGNKLEKGTMLQDIPFLPGGPWMHGRRLTLQVKEPLEFGLSPSCPGQLLALYKGAIPLIRDDLLQLLRETGVDNIESFRTVLKDPVANKVHNNYKAFNVVGIVSCADMAGSKRSGVSNSNLINAGFDSLVIDEKKTGGLLLFRLAESVSAIVVHRKIKEAVDARAFPGMFFYGPGEWAG